MAFREWGDPSNPRVLLCLHGLTRAGSDFDVFARAMRDQYRVVCPDIAGRGLSDRLRNPKLYGVPHHANDVATLLATLHAETVDVLGTSMGGLIGMVLAGLPGSPIRKFLLNDVGPVIDPVGLSRISDYVGQDPRFATADEGVAYLNALTKNFGPHTPEQSDALNRPLIRHYENGWGLHYDPGIGAAFRATTPELSALAEAAAWHAWSAASAQVLITRGERSDLLSKETVAEMLRRNRQATAVEFADTGHAPAFIVPAQVAAARAFFVDR